MWRNVSKWDPSRQPQTITSSFFFLFWQEDFLMVFLLGKIKITLEKAPFFQKKISNIQLKSKMFPVLSA